MAVKSLGLRDGKEIGCILITIHLSLGSQTVLSVGSANYTNQNNDTATRHKHCAYCHDRFMNFIFLGRVIESLPARFAQFSTVAEPNYYFSQ